MKFTKMWGAKGPKLSLADVIAAGLEEDDVADRGLAMAQNTAKAFGMLVELLHDRGVIGTRDVFENFNTGPYEESE